MNVGCMHLEADPSNRPGEFGTYYWCDAPADPRSAPGAPRCAEHLTPDTTRQETTK